METNQKIGGLSSSLTVFKLVVSDFGIAQTPRQKVVKTLSTRTHRCPHCGYLEDRGENAAINILKSALKEWANTVGRTELEVSGEIPRMQSCWKQRKVRELNERESLNSDVWNPHAHLSWGVRQEDVLFCGDRLIPNSG